MRIQVNTDNHTQGSAGLTAHAEEVLRNAMSRFGERITRIEVHLTDLNSEQKSVGNDKRCRLEARLAGLQPITVSDEAATIEQALKGATDKLQTTLTRTIGKMTETKGRTSFAGEQS